MSLIRYQTPNTALWRSLDRWADLRDEVANLFDGPVWPNPAGQAQLFSGWTPALDLYQTTDDVVVVVELPGMRKEDIDVSLQDGMLTVSGERKDAIVEGDQSGRTERFTGTFRRSISLPTRVDGSKVNAAYQDGILTVTLPKAEEVKPKQINVN